VSVSDNTMAKISCDHVPTADQRGSIPLPTYMRERLRCRFGGGCLNTGAVIIIWCGVMVRRDMMIS